MVTVTRDFVYVQDIVQANLLAMESKNAVGESFNIGSGARTSVNHVAQTLKDAVNKRDIKNDYVDARPSDLKHGYANISKARRMLKYTPSFPFEKGIADLVHHARLS